MKKKKDYQKIPSWSWILLYRKRCILSISFRRSIKVKEISCLHAEGYPAGEMKHGPIALADPELFTMH